jgi:hypothetical protein
MLVPLVFLIRFQDGRLKDRIFRTTPFIVTAVLFFLYRSIFTIPMVTPGSIPGSNSLNLTSLMMNTIYTIEYTIFPIDLHQATTLLNEHRTALVILSGLVLIIFAILAWHIIKAGRSRAYRFPIAFTFLTGILTMISFERWRVYMMSVGMTVLIVLVLSELWKWNDKKMTKMVAAMLFILLVGFYSVRSDGASCEWTKATMYLQSLSGDLEHILAANPSRPVKFLFLDRPAKLGSAPVLQIGVNDVLEQAELNRLHSPELAVGGKSDTININSETTVLINALDANEGFKQLQCKKLSPFIYQISVPENAPLTLIPTTTKSEGLAMRDQQLENGDTLQSSFADIILLETDRTSARNVKIIVKDTTLIPILFDGNKFVVAGQY